MESSSFSSENVLPKTTLLSEQLQKPNVDMMKNPSGINSSTNAYISGFLDGDGSVFCSIVERSDYKAHYQIRFCITFHQKTSRLHFLMQIKHDLKYGVLRDRKDGVSELNIVGWQSVKNVLERLLPFLRVKRKQANLILKIIENLSDTKSSPSKFLQMCHWVDQVSALNDSPLGASTRRVTAKSVEEKYEKLGLLSADNTSAPRSAT